METLLSSADDLKYLLEELAIPSASSELPNKLESSLQSFYNNSIAVTSKKFGSFDSLIVENLDPDSIWEEIRSRCDPLSKYLDKKISSIEDRLIAKEQVDYDNGVDVDDEDEDIENEMNDNEDNNDDNEFSDNKNDDDDDVDDENIHNKDEYDFDYGDEEDRENDVDDDEDDEDNMADDDGGDANNDNEEVEGDMEEYLDEIERDEMRREVKAMRKTATEKGHKGLLEYDEDTEEDDGEYVQRVMYQDDDDNDDEDDEDEEEVGGVEGKGIMYSDFFLPPIGSSSSSSSSSLFNKTKTNSSSSSSLVNSKGKGQAAKKMSSKQMDATIVGAKIKAGDAKHKEDEEMYYNQNDDEDEDDDEDADFDNLVDDYNDDEEDEDEEDNQKMYKSKEKAVKALTPYEKKQQAKQKEIAALEAAVTGQKSWDMRGEIKGADRPENSLLELTTDIERASKPAPVVTESYTSSIEELIIKRVMDEQYDDVIPQETKNTDDLEDDGQGIPVVSQEKSKLGLGEVYANEYLLRAGHQSTTSAAASEAEDVLRKTVKGLFHKICRDLDSLSNFYFTPKPVAAEGSVTATAAVPAILLEDVAPYRPHALAPVSATDGSSNQGPEQLYAKKRGREGALLTINEKELTQDDRKRIRRARKETQHKINIQEKGHEKFIAKTNKDSQEHRKYENQKTDEILKFDKRVTVGKQSNRHQNSGNGSGTNASAVGDTGSSGGSNNFFEQLQEQVANDIQRKANSMNGSNSHKNKHAVGNDSHSKSNNNSNSNGKKFASNVYKL